VIDPNGRDILLGGAIVAEFDGDKISAFRNYFDDATLLVQMLAE
jgi:limonene-1,2-epoxide hydrolase